MGFGMRGIDRPSLWLSGLHFSLALSLPFLLVFFMGCNKVKEEKADYGPEVPGDSIDLALSKAVNGASLNNVAIGQYLDHTVTRRLENEESVTTLGGTRVEVVDKQETDTSVKFFLKIYRSERLSNGQFETRVTEEPLVLSKNGSLQSRLSSTALAQEARAKAQAAQRKVQRVSYHNLREFTEVTPPPKTVRQKAGCGGLDPCQLEVRYIRFDMVQWYEGGGSTKVALDFGFSVQPPFLPFGENFDQFTGLLVVDCRSTYVPIESRTVYVRDCVTLEDFQK